MSARRRSRRAPCCISTWPRLSTGTLPTPTWTRVSLFVEARVAWRPIEVDGLSGAVDAQQTDLLRWSSSPDEDQRPRSCSTWKPSQSGEAPDRSVPYAAGGCRQSRWLVAQDRPKATSRCRRKLPHWDYQTTVELAAPVSVDRRAVTEACRLDFEVVWRCWSWRGRITPTPSSLQHDLELPMSDTFDLAVEIAPGRGPNLGAASPWRHCWSSPTPGHSTASLRSTPEASSGGPANGPTSKAWVPSSQLTPWTSRRSDSTRGAGWQLRIDLTDPEARFMSAARLTLNSGHPAIERLLNGAKDDGTEQLLRALNWDVTRQMVQAALASDEVQVSTSIPRRPPLPESSGTFSDESGRSRASQLSKDRNRTDPARIEVHLQHHSGLLRDRRNTSLPATSQGSRTRTDCGAVRSQSRTISPD